MDWNNTYFERHFDLGFDVSVNLKDIERCECRR